MTTRTNYDHELDQLHSDLKHMAGMVETAIERTFIAFEDRNYQLAEEVIKRDRAINDMERSIESRCLSLILRQQPVAGDLRVVSTALKIVTDLERIGDHASDIAELILRIRGENTYSSCLIKHLPAMAAEAQSMVHDSIAAFVSMDTEAAQQIIARDDFVDALFHKVKEEVIELLQAPAPPSDQYVDFLMIAKYLERIGDHAVNVCEWTEFCKHGVLKNVRIL